MSVPSITCLVPTHRRPQFLRRLLRFYRQVPPGFRIVAVDSSDAALADENARVVAEACAAGLDVEHRRSDLDFIGKCRAALEATESPFVCLCADDDVIFPDAVYQCADFLEQHPGYISAQGRTAQVYPGRRWFGCVRLKGFDITDDDPFVRCRTLAGSFFSNFYSVYRREQLAENFRITAANSDSRLSYTMPEMLLSQLSALRGRIKVLPVMHLLMERHPTNAGYLGRSGVRQQAEEMYQRFKSGLAAEFVSAGINRTLAESYIDEFFGYFRESSLAHRKRRRSLGESLNHKVRSLQERAAEFLADEQTRHRRLIRASDYAGSEAAWNTAVQLIREFPLGIPEG
jgi:glycosyltransferase domain-containing protein